MNTENTNEYKMIRRKILDWINNQEKLCIAKHEAMAIVAIKTNQYIDISQQDKRKRISRNAVRPRL